MRSRPASDSEGNRSPRTDREPTSWSRRIVEGAKGGLVATLVMTAYRLPISHALPPTALFWSKFVAGGDPNDYPLPGLVLHLLYGTAAGVLFGVLSPKDRWSTPARGEAVGLLLGVGYGVVLSVVGERVVLNRFLDMQLDPDDTLVFHVGHVVYGLTLGTWFGSRTSDEQ